MVRLPAFFMTAKKPSRCQRTHTSLSLAWLKAWQKFEAGQQPSYIMATPGKAPPPKPDVPESEWPKDLSGNKAHPYRWTRYLYLVVCRYRRDQHFHQQHCWRSHCY